MLPVSRPFCSASYQSRIFASFSSARPRPSRLSCYIPTLRIHTRLSARLDFALNRAYSTAMGDNTLIKRPKKLIVCCDGKAENYLLKSLDVHSIDQLKVHG
jgi:hypothetical protein